MKREGRILDGTPSKRSFWAIINDYDLHTSICELIDNALDLYLKSKQLTPVSIRVSLDTDRQAIRIEDTAGGVPEKDLDLLIRPGGTTNTREQEIIGVFGVGSKRAVVALAEEITIRSRKGNGPSYRVDIDNDWLVEDESWELPAYTTEPIPEGSTIIEMRTLRKRIGTQEIENLRTHIAETYANYVAGRKFHILVNGVSVTPLNFDQWAYPPTYGPKELSFELTNDEGEKVRGTITAGLVREKRPGGDDYGVYFYCNNRLIAKEIKDKAVGYITSYAGIPHSDASLARVIVSVQGPAKAMPWNSTKSAIIFAHPTFSALQNSLSQILTYYSKLSRGLRSQWDESVFAYKTGKVQRLKLRDVQRIQKSYLPPIPKAVKHRIDHLRADNEQIMKDKPWTVGLVESIAAVDLIRKQKFQTKNRIALLLLDSSLEIALKEFIVYTDGLDLRGKTEAHVLRRRPDAIEVVDHNVSLGAATLGKLNYYYRLRNQLIHERATAAVTPEDIDNYQETVQGVLEKLFGLRF